MTGPPDRETLARVLRALLVERRRWRRQSMQRDVWTAAARMVLAFAAQRSS
jgi:hypothetical protein